jgi:hypothetical protein
MCNSVILVKSIWCTALLQELWSVEHITHESWLVGTDGDLR